MSRVEIRYRRPPDRLDVFVQELVDYQSDDEDRDLTLWETIADPMETTEENIEKVKEVAGTGQFRTYGLMAMASVALGTLGIVASLLWLAKDQMIVPAPVAEAIADDAPEAVDEAEDERLEAVGNAAGRVVEQAGAAGGGNAVYRAWREMTDALEIERPETTTPEEFADEAVAAGMARDDVRELTEIFEAVRYGDADVTEARERRAMDALRRIEDTYGGGRP